MLRETPVDYVIAGEGERSLVRLLDHLFGGGPREAVGGLYFRHGEEVVLARPPEFIADLNALPRPDYEVIDQEKYASCLSYAGLNAPFLDVWTLYQKGRIRTTIERVDRSD